MTLITNLGILAAALLCAIAANHESQCRGRPMAALLFRVAAVLCLVALVASVARENRHLFTPSARTPKQGAAA